MNAFVFPAGDVAVRHTIAVHRLTDAYPPRRWSVEVNRDKVSAGDIAFLWQTGDSDDLWRPGLWAAGVVYRFDDQLEKHWRDPNQQTMYADLEMTWVGIIDRADIRADADAGGAMQDCVLAAKHGQIRSPLLLRDVERDWLLSAVGRNNQAWIRRMQKRALPHNA